jgi:GxxExxY protein
MKQTDDLSGAIIGAAIRVHTELGPGYLESIYEEALAREFDVTGLAFRRQCPFEVLYREVQVGEHRLDFLVEEKVAVEQETVTGFDPIHFAVLRSYLKATRCELGLLLNFAATTLQVKRVGREWHSRVQ